MKNPPQSILLCLGFLLISQIINAQLWKPIDYHQKLSHLALETRKNMPSQFDLFALAAVDFGAFLKNAPSKASPFSSGIVIAIPSGNGVLKNYKIVEASVLSAGLQKEFPGIRSYTGHGIEDPTARIHFSFSKIGFHGMITSAHHGTLYIDPYTKNKQHYISYFKSDLEEHSERFQCLVANEFGGKSTSNSSSNLVNANDGILRTFRLALACTGEYAQFHLENQGIPDEASEATKKEAVLAAMNVTMTRVNSIFERDLAITMAIVDDNLDLIFLDPETDAFTNDETQALMAESQTVCDAVIGRSNYDIGHTFSTGGGGLAVLRSPCTSSKARGVTGIRNPIGDDFDINYVIHEMGHQFGASHTQNNDCNSTEKSVEPGSGSTIMGYAGICSPNVQRNSDSYFHAINIAEMWENITEGSGTCGLQLATNNMPPTADAGSDFTIPASTPFILQGIGLDPDSDDLLSYCWEQMDAETAFMPPEAFSDQGPSFRSLAPTRESARYMPALATVIQGQTASEWEVVPSVSRVMNFRLTVRDNALYGNTASDDTQITVVDVAGPFLVTSPNTDLSWEGNTTQTVTWDVAGTTTNGINASTVTILLSIDGGLTYPITIASDVANDGSHDINVPNSPGNENRIMVQGSEHIFYDISDVNFEITSGTPLATTRIVEERKVEAYPNPLGPDEVFYIHANQQFETYEILDIKGRRIAKGKLHQNTITRGSWGSGVYLLRLGVDQGNQSLMVRFVQE